MAEIFSTLAANHSQACSVAWVERSEIQGLSARYDALVSIAFRRGNARDGFAWLNPSYKK
jgi:hypothetical protein